MTKTSSTAREHGATSGNRRLEAIRDVSSFVSLVSGLFTLFQPIVEALRRGRLRPASTFTTLQLVVAGFLIGVGMILRFRRWRRRSRLLHPDLLNDRLSRQLVGRGDDVEFLLDFVASSSLVWLTGESGVGKSTLLTLGLLPRLQSDTSAVTYLLTDLGVDWTTGPYNALARAIARASPADGNFPITGDQAINHLRALAASDLGRRPLLIFDQFDDYQVRHRSQFIRRGRILSTEALCAASPFWNDIAELVRDGVIVAMFVTRDTEVPFLESVRFAEPTVYHLGGLPPGFVLSLLDGVIGSDLISWPNAGWTQLRSRLVIDLEAHGRLLPIELSTVIRGLPVLRDLTLASYQRAGGLPWLATANLAHEVEETAAYTRVDPATIRSLLLVMVDTTHKNTVPATAEQLSEALPPPRRDDGTLSSVLDYLATRHILRARIDQATLRGAYMLDHDYLAHGLVTLERMAQHQQLYLDSATEQFSQAVTVVGKWRALLPPFAQLRLAHAWLRGTVRFDNARSFVAMSAVRWLINVPLALGLALGIFLHQRHGHERASNLFSHIGITSTNNDLTKREAKALWMLAHADAAIRFAVLSQAIGDDASAAQFNQRQENIITATVGLNAGVRLQVVKELLPRCYSRHWTGQNTVFRACEALASSLDPEPNRLCSFYVDTALHSWTSSFPLAFRATGCGEVTTDQANSHRYRLSHAIRETKNLGRLRMLTSLLTDLPGSSSDTGAPLLVDHVFRILRGSPTLDDQIEAADVLAGIPGQWRTGQALEVSRVMLEIRDKDISRDRSTPPRVNDATSVSMSMATVAKRLAPAEATLLWPQAIRTKWERNAYYSPDSDQQVLETLARAISVPEAPAAYALLLDTASDPSADARKEQLLIAVAPLVASRVASDERPRLAARTARLMSQTNFTDEFEVYARGWGALEQRAPQGGAGIICKQLHRLFDARKLSSNEDVIASLVSLPPSSCQAEAEAMLSAMLPRLEQLAQKPGYWGEFDSTAEAVADLGVSVGWTHTHTATERILRLAHRVDGPARSVLIKCLLEGFAPNLSSADLQFVYNEVWRMDQPRTGRMMMVKQGPPRDTWVKGLAIVAKGLDRNFARDEFRKGLQSLHAPQPLFGAVSNDTTQKAMALLLPAIHGEDRRALYEETIQALLEAGRKQNSGKAFVIAEVLKEFGPMGPVHAAEELLHAYSEMLSPPCSTLTAILEPRRPELLVEVMKWPTCDAQSRRALVTWAAQAKELSFPGSTPGNRRVATWRFASWAKQRGLDVDTPPSTNPRLGESLP